MRRPLTWLLLACAIAAAIGLGFVLSRSPIRILQVVVWGWLLVASVVLLSVSATRTASPFPSTGRIIASQVGLLSLVAFGIYVLLEAPQPWPGVVVLGAAAVIEAVLIFVTVRGRRSTRTL